MIDFIYNIPGNLLGWLFVILGFLSLSAKKKDFSFTHNNKWGNFQVLIFLGWFIVSVMLVTKVYNHYTGYKPTTVKQKTRQELNEILQKIKKENPIKPTEKKNFWKD